MPMLLRILLFLLLALVLAAAALLWAALDAAPRVTGTADISAAQVEKARALVRRHDPRRLAPGAQRLLVLDQDEVDLLLALGARRFPGARARLVLTPQGADGAMTLALPAPLPRRFVNVDFVLRQAHGSLQPQGLRVGRIALPDPVTGRLARALLARLRGDPDWGFAVAAVKGADVVAAGRRPPLLRLTYTVPAGLRGRLSALAVPPHEAQRLLAYQAALAQAVAAAPPARQVALTRLLPPLFQLARQRSGGDGAVADGVAENRAALLVLALYASHRRLGEVLPEANRVPQPAPRVVLLGGREDFAQHLLVSAALASRAGGAVADALGLSKELDDARAGSGFSFTDLAVDRAGARLGTLATADATALRLQERFAAGAREADLLPAMEGLPEFLPDPEFRRRFGGPGQAAYEQVLRDIEARVARLLARVGFAPSGMQASYAARREPG